MIFSYSRVSTQSQNLDRQQEAIQEYCNLHNIKIDREYTEKASGKDFNREVYQGMKLTLRNGDLLIIKELSRLGRNMEQIKNEWQELQQMGVDIIVIDTEIINTNNKSDLEKTLISNIVFELLSYLSQKERERIKKSQAEGIRIAKEKGLYKGRKPIVINDFDKVYQEWEAKKITAVAACKKLNVSRNTFYRRVKAINKEIR